MDSDDKHDRMAKKARTRGEASTIDGAYPNEILDACPINMSMVSAAFQGEEVTITDFSAAATDFGDTDYQCSNKEAKAYLERLVALGKAEERGVATYYINEASESEYV